MILRVRSREVGEFKEVCFGERSGGLNGDILVRLGWARFGGYDGVFRLFIE